ncbi:alpha/beta-hydrolase [Neoconidiobolus thromboides FSU 785]|nr:alpha/beta-hydrolase [Neoconidiobolus thromboides FSU 785]
MVFEFPKHVINSSKQYPVQTRQYSSESEKCVYHIHPSKTGTSPAPLLIFIESAVFLSPEMATGFDQLADQLSQLGIHVVRLQYRLTSDEGTVQFPGHLIDCMKGYIEIVTKLGFSYDSIYLAGHSIGALISLLIGFNSTKYLKLLSSYYNNNDFLYLFNRINGIISIAGVFDLVSITKSNAFFSNNVASVAFKVEGDASKLTFGSSNLEDTKRMILQYPESEDVIRPATNEPKLEDTVGMDISLPRMGICQPKIDTSSSRMIVFAPGINNHSALKEHSVTSVKLKDVNEMNYSNLPKVLLIGSSEDTAVPMDQLLLVSQHLFDLNVKDVTLLYDRFGNHNQIIINPSVIKNIAKFVLLNNDSNIYRAKL